MITQKFILDNPSFGEFLNYFVEKNIPCIIFGSYAKGTFGKYSDIDILVLSSAKLPEHLCPAKIHLISLSKSEFESSVRKKEALIREIVDNHIIVNGVDYFARLLDEKD